MKLYYSPMACSLADRIALLEAGVTVEYVRVDLRTKRTMAGEDFTLISPKGYVPALVLDNGETLTENIAVLDWIANRYPVLGKIGPLGRARLLEALSYISTEIHGSFKPFWHGNSNAEKARAGKVIAKQFELLSGGTKGPYLLGETPCVADFYLFVMLIWARRFSVQVPDRFSLLEDRIASRRSTQVAMREEGLL